MKLTKKLRYLFSLTSLLICLSMGTVCVNADTSYDDYYAVEETTTSKEDAQTFAKGQITLGEAKSIVEQYVSAIAQYATCSKEELEYIADATSYQTDVYANFAKIVGDDGCGAYSSYDGVEVIELEDENKVEINAVIHFSEKDIKIVLGVTFFDTIGKQVTSTEFALADAGQESMASKMISAGTNTIIGMGVVFCVLIFISLIISCFAFIPKITEKIQNRKNGTKEVQDTFVEQPSMEVTIEDNTELIAVIAAAIAASEQTSTDSFVVRSIRRR